MRLQKGILPDLVGMAHWNVPALVDAMIIIQGRIKDATTEIEFTAPSYIPSTSRILQILVSKNILVFLKFKCNIFIPK